MAEGLSRFTRKDVLEALMAQKYVTFAAGTIGAHVDFERYPVLGKVGDKGPAFQALMDELGFGIAWMTMGGKQALIINPYDNSWEELEGKLVAEAEKCGLSVTTPPKLASAPRQLPEGPAR